MNKYLLAALGAGSMIAMAAPAAAQNVTGTVNITGSVAPKCLVVPNNGSTFGTTVALGELAGADGKLRPNVATDFNASTGLTARVVCTTAAPTISVDADPITAATALGGGGYDNSIDFTASVAVTTTSGAAGPFTNDSADPAGSDTLIGGRLANNGSDNIAITASNFRTNNADDLLAADPTYTGKITVVIKPGA
ncbi:MAG: hypothetical protein ACTHJR_03225 [Sphingomonas sp.]|uniref:hypothetical protein n=1 Tax=Sphingomonas sp. TaxID=28214 RepID=UPI003F7E17DD